MSYSCGRSQRKQPVPFKRGLKRYLAAEIMPSVKTALTQCAVVGPADPLLWLSRHFLSISEAADQYELRKQSATLRTYRTASTTAIATKPMPSFTAAASVGTADVTLSLSLNDDDRKAIEDATAPSRRIQDGMLSRSTHPILAPLTTWEKRIRRVTGKSVHTGMQTGGGYGCEKGTQARTMIKTQETQTMLTGKEALIELGEEMQALSRRTKEMKSEEEAIHEVFQRLYFDGMGMDQRLIEMFDVLDPNSVGVARSKLLRYVVSRPSLRKTMPGLRGLLRPESWKRTFNEMCGSGTVAVSSSNGTGQKKEETKGTELEIKQASKNNSNLVVRRQDVRLWLSKRAVVTRKGLVHALEQDHVLAAVLRWSEALHPLLRPREYHRVFQAITQCAATPDAHVGNDRISEAQLVSYVRTSRVGSAEDAASETVSSLFNLMCEDDGHIGKSHLLRIVTGVNTSTVAEEVRAVLSFSVSLRPLLRPKEWSRKFDEMDSDGDGLLSYDEFSTFLRSFTSQDGELARREEEQRLREGEMRIAQELTADTMLRIKRLFDQMDPQKTGVIDRFQFLKAVLDDPVVREMLRDEPPLRNLLHPSKWSKVFAKVDSDDDQRLNYGEFVEFVFASYAKALASEGNYGANFSIAMLRGVALGAGRVGAKIGALEQSVIEETIKKSEQQTVKRVQQAVEEAKRVKPPPSWRLDLPAAHRAAILIQKRWRGVEERMWQTLVKTEMKKQWMLNMSATMIQAAWRGYMSRINLPEAGEEDVLWHEILQESASIIQRAFRAFSIRNMLGVGHARRDDVWIGVRPFTARDDEELTMKVGDLLWLRSDLIDPRTAEDGTLIGWYRASMFNAEQEVDNRFATAEVKNVDILPGSRLVPSNCVRRCSREERLQARQGRLPVWARLRCGRYRRDYYHNNLTGRDVWKKPAEYTEPHPMDVLRGLHLAPDVRGAVCMQRAWRHREARLKYLKRCAFASGILVRGWLIATDSRTNLPFWYQPSTDELRWTKPEVVDDEEKKLSKNALESGREARKERRKMAKERAQEKRKLMQSGVKRKLEAEKKVLEVEFNEGPIGLHLKPRKNGGVLVTFVEPGCPAADILRKGMVLTGFRKKRTGIAPELSVTTEAEKNGEKEQGVQDNDDAKKMTKTKKQKKKTKRELKKEKKKEQLLAKQKKKEEEEKEKEKKKLSIATGNGNGNGNENAANDSSGLVEATTSGMVAGVQVEEGQQEENENQADSSQEQKQEQVLVEDPLYSINVDWSNTTDLCEVTQMLKDTPRPVILLFVPLKSMRVAEETVKAEHNSMLGRKTVVVTFGQGSMGIEFAPRRKGGCVLLRLIQGGIAETLYGRRLRKSMSLMSINARPVEEMHFDDVLDLLRTEPRPIKLQFLSAPSRGPRARTPDGWNGAPQSRPISPPGFGAPPRSPMGRRGRGGGGNSGGRGGGRDAMRRRSRSPAAARTCTPTLITKTFEDGAIGIEFVSRRKGGVLIKNIVEDTQSWKMIDPPLRKAMWLKSIGEINVEGWSMREILSRIAAMPRPMECTFMTAPGKDWSVPERQRPESTPSSTTPIGMVLSHSEQHHRPEIVVAPMVVEDKDETHLRSKLLAEQYM